MARNTGRFYFDGGAVSFLGTGIGAVLLTFCTFGIGFLFALVLFERWRARHTSINGQRLMFSGTGMGLIALAVKVCFLCLITFGIYAVWVVPRIQERKIAHTHFDPTWRPNTLG